MSFHLKQICFSFSRDRKKRHNELLDYIGHIKWPEIRARTRKGLSRRNKKIRTKKMYIYIYSKTETKNYVFRTSDEMRSHNNEKSLPTNANNARRTHEKTMANHISSQLTMKLHRKKYAQQTIESNTQPSFALGRDTVCSFFFALQLNANNMYTHFSLISSIFSNFFFLVFVVSFALPIGKRFPRNNF